jgi:phosphopantothenoylcysteine decarboxylase/phosphopantothenate--cysteine ligase
LKGIGRMEEPAALLGHARLLLSRGGPLQGRKVLVTAGGTQEPIDPVRVITNRSSGKQGYALAQAALDLGADVTLVSAPVHISAPIGVRQVGVRTARQMLDAVLAELPDIDVLIMAAAVADFTPADPQGAKIKKEKGLREVRLEPTADILKAVDAYRQQKGRPRLVVGFAAESGDLLDNAHSKLVSKGLDMIVANDISAQDAGFEVDTNRITILDREHEAQALPLMSKPQAAGVILERVLQLPDLQAG